MSIDSGRVYRTSIRDITKGHSDPPEPWKGSSFITITISWEALTKIQRPGSYGSLEPDSALSGEMVPVDTARKEEIHTGDATVRCYVGNSLKEYQIRCDRYRHVRSRDQ